MQAFMDIRRKEGSGKAGKGHKQKGTAEDRLTCQCALASLSGSFHSANLGLPPAGPACVF